MPYTATIDDDGYAHTHPVIIHAQAVAMTHAQRVALATATPGAGLGLWVDDPDEDWFVAMIVAWSLCF